MVHPVTFEHISFPGLDREQALLLQRELEAMEAAAQLFAAGLYSMDVQIAWSVGGYSRPARWLRNRSGKISVQLWLDLESPLNLPPDPYYPRRLGPEDFKTAFRAGFLHALGRITACPAPEDRGCLEVALDVHHPRWRRLPLRVRSWLAEPEGRRALQGAWERLEGARADTLLAQRYRGATRHQLGRRAAERADALFGEPARALVGALCLGLRENTSGDLLNGEVLSALGPEVAASVSRLLPRLRLALQDPPGVGAYVLAEAVVYELAPALLELAELSEIEEPAAGAAATASPRPARRQLAALTAPAEISAGGVGEAVATRIVFLPHRDGGEAMIRIDAARARELVSDDLTSRVLTAVAGRYGPDAREALAEYSGPLRRALRANWERRRRGAYRSGRHIGIPNLRRFLTLDDPRLFQRLEKPQGMSYYFHLLVDTSYSMFEKDNAPKAFAIAYAFTELLHSLSIPVDVTLYSSGVTELFDHRVDALDLWFGGDFGYLISGTLEMEAIAFAKIKAASVQAERKVFVVVTDGTPVASSLGFVGGSSLVDYYRETLIPWLRRSGIELMAIGIGVEPGYHETAVQLTDTWDSLEVLIRLLEELVAEGLRRTGELWT